MNKKASIPRQFFILLIIILIVFLIIYSLSLGMETKQICKDECDRINAMAFQRIQNGKLDLKDVCICYFEDSFKIIQIIQPR